MSLTKLADDGLVHSADDSEVTRLRDVMARKHSQVLNSTSAHQQSGSGRRGLEAKTSSVGRLAPTAVRSAVQHFQLLIVFAVKICKQCLQTASPSVGLQPQTL